MTSIIIVPTYNESENVPELAWRLRASGYEGKVLVVDDSLNDETANAARKVDFQVLKRTDKKGLSSAVIDGLSSLDGEVDKVIIMDADLQHPPEFVPELFRKLDEHDFVVASRYVDGGDCDEWDLDRKVISRVANLAARPLTGIKDAVSGFFGFRRSGLPNLDVLNNRGFKIMLELLVKGHWDSTTEIPYTFGVRKRGQTKMRFEQIRDYLFQLVSLYLHRFRILRFGIVGLSGIVVHLPILYALTEFVGLLYLWSAVISIICASTSNYFLNHLWTFQDRQEHIRNHFLGWGKYQLVSGTTDVLYLGVLALLVELGDVYYMLSAGISMVTIFIVKYLVAKSWIWGKL